MPTPADDPARPPYMPHPRRRLPRVRGWCGFIENGAYKGCPFSTTTDAPRRLPTPTPRRPGAGFLRYAAITAPSLTGWTIGKGAACCRSARKQLVFDGQQATGNRRGSSSGDG